MFPAACAGIATNATVTIIAALITPAMAFFVFALMEPKSRFPPLAQLPYVHCNAFLLASP
jgi:hypothetical protein